VSVVLTILFIAINLYLWSLPITQLQLLLISGPLGVIHFSLFLWLASSSGSA
jgi:hypothetical protein